ncbi:MAG: sphingomyelin phosphodiesterase [Pseudomonadales bacterium]|nr:sphingomyelin phosphodiesterase [Pseudomonadales bacterium]MDP7357401.1 sphingomyelin phosphodiesterase [Pseudomonadales bacterium]MDP7595527.1 sphingomyelin phosphodiesterase [Pseudomonadales bacterium]
MLSYNVFLRTPAWIFRDQHDWRAHRIPSFLAGYDAVVLQEAFSNKHRNRMLSTLSREYPYSSGILGEDEFMSYNGGVIILSRWPIVKQAYTVFNVCEGTDCIVKKGVIYTALEKEGARMHLFGLHLQAQKEHSATRVAQFPRIRHFIDAQHIDKAELLLVAGDFNVDYFSNISDREFSRLSDTVGLVLAQDTPAPSYDAASNSYVEDPVSERLDYVFYSGRHLTPEKASNEVLYFRDGSTDLSDHHPVVGRFTIGHQP